MSETNTYLLDLPVELIEWITKLTTSVDDLLSLRLVCRDLEAITSNIFTRRFFRDKAFIVANRTSMKTLLAISKHDRLAKSMKLVRFSLITMPPSPRNKDGKVTHYPPSLRYLPRKGASRALCLERRCRFTELLIEQDEYMGSRNNLQLDMARCEMVKDLGNIFQNFLDRGVAPGVVGVGVDLFTERAPMGLQRMKSALGYEDSLSFDRCQSLQAILSALAKTQYPVPELVLGSYYNSVGLVHLAQYRISPKHLRKIDLCISALLRNHWHVTTLTFPHALVAGLLMTIAQAPYLTELAVSFGFLGALYDMYKQIQIGLMKLSELPSRSPIPMLKKIRLEDLPIYPLAIECIVKQYISSLEELIFRDSRQWNDELETCRDRVLQFIRNRSRRNVQVLFSGSQ